MRQGTSASAVKHQADTMNESSDDLLTCLMDQTDPAPDAATAPRAGDAAALRVGDAVELRVVRGGREIEAWSARLGQRLGRLPPAERDVVAPLLGPDYPPVTGRISALVPRPRHAGTGRIHVRLSGLARAGG
jgi:hypothetical protein